MPIEIVGCFAIFTLLTIANIAGLGGGGSVIIIAMVFFGFDTKQAIAQSNASIFISSVLRYAWNFRVSHPYKDGKGVLVDYNVASLMLPVIIIGASLGVMLNKIFPSLVIAIFLVVCLIFVSYTTLRKLL